MNQIAPTNTAGINELAKALSAAQAEMPNAPMNRVNPHFRSKYADLAAIREATLPSLTKHGLAIIQRTEVLNETILLVTELAHSSGQVVQSFYPIPFSDKPQVMGSALTYARRYSWAALCGVASEDDDDGNAGQDGAKKNGAKRTQVEISANKVRKHREWANIEAELAQIESLSELERYKREVLTPDFMSGLGTSQFAVDEWVTQREMELRASEGGVFALHEPATRADYIQDCHDKVAAFANVNELQKWWNTEAAARRRFGLKPTEVEDLKERVTTKRDALHQSPA